MTSASKYHYLFERVVKQNKQGDIVIEEKPYQEVKDHLVVGKSDFSDVKIQNWQTSGIHCVIIKNDLGEIDIIDLGSLHGIKVNQKKVSHQLLKNGDVIEIGDAFYVFRQESDVIPFAATPQNKVHHLPNNPDITLNGELTTLEVSFYWGDQKLEVKSFNAGDEISIGDPAHADFPIPPKLRTHLSETFVIGKYVQGMLKLTLPPFATGLIWTESKTVSLDSLRYFDEKFKGKEILEINLTLGERANIEFGELSLNFKFVKPEKRLLPQLLPRLDKQIAKIITAIFLVYLLGGLLFWIKPETPPEVKTLKDLPPHLKKVAFQSGIEQADKARRAAIGEIQKNLAGRAKSEEGKMQNQPKPEAKSEPKEEVKSKKIAKKTKPTKTKQKLKNVKNRKSNEKMIAKTLPDPKRTPSTTSELDKMLEQSTEITPSSVNILSKVGAASATPQALAQIGESRGKKGFGAGGGGAGSGTGALKGSSSGGALGSLDSGMLVSKGKSIQIQDLEEISVEDGLDPELIAQRIKKYLPQIQHCYETELIKNPSLKGKVNASFTIMGDGTVSNPKIFETTLKHLPTEKCITGKIKNWNFPKPKGGGTVGVKYPFLLMSNTGN